MRAMQHEMEDITSEITQLRREMATTRELVSRMHTRGASVEPSSAFMTPYNHQEVDGVDSGAVAASTLGQSIPLLGGRDRVRGGSNSDLIRMDSMRSVSRSRSRSDLPLINTFTSRM